MTQDVVKDMLQTAKDQFHVGMMLDYDGDVGDDPHEFVRGIAKDAGRKALLVLEKARANPHGANDGLVMNMAADATVGLMSGCAAAYEAAHVSALVADIAEGRDAEHDVAEAAQGMAEYAMRVISSDGSGSLAGLLSSIVAATMFMDGSCYGQIKAVDDFKAVCGVIDCVAETMRPVAYGDADMSKLEGFDKAFVLSLLTVIRLVEDAAPETTGMWITRAIRGEGLPGLMRKTLLIDVPDAIIAGARNNNLAVTAANGRVTVH